MGGDALANRSNTHRSPLPKSPSAGMISDDDAGVGVAGADNTTTTTKLAKLVIISDELVEDSRDEDNNEIPFIPFTPDTLGEGGPKLGRKAWSLRLQEEQEERMMAMGSRAADEEARAEVEVLNSRLEKTAQLTKKIQASLNRLETSGKSLADAIKPIAGSTQRLQVFERSTGASFCPLHPRKCVANSSFADIDNLLSAIDKVRQPSDIKNNEEDIIRKGPDGGRLNAFLNSVKRVNGALAELRQTNLRSNQDAITDLTRLLKSGNAQLEGHFERLLQIESEPIEALQYTLKDKPFPAMNRENLNSLAVINNYIVNEVRNPSSGDSPTLQMYARIRGPWLTATLKNMSTASLAAARNKKNPDAIYVFDSNGIGYYAKAMEGLFVAEYDNICGLFAREEWGKAFNLTCQGAISELARTLRELNSLIKASLTTDCYLAYEIIEAMSNLSSNMESRTGELKPSFAAALKPIRETGKSSLADLLEDTRRRVGGLTTLPTDGSAVPITTEVMVRLQTMVNFLRPISSIMISLGDGGWKTSASSVVSTDQIPSLNSFDITADGNQIFAHYCLDTIDTLLGSLDQRAKPLLRAKQTLGVFIANNAVIIDRMIRSSDLQSLLATRMADVDKWRKNGVQLYTMAWREPSTHLLDVQYTNRGGQRPTSGSAAAIDSAAILKGLSSKDKDAIKEKFRLFNASFDDLIGKHRSLSMEREVREILARQVQSMIEPLYGRFWDRYHEVDKGKGKHVKYDKAAISKIFASL